MALVNQQPLSSVNPGTYSGPMTKDKNLREMLARVPTREAAALAGVSERTIKRWAAAGRLTVQYRRLGERAVCATYDVAEVRAAMALRGGRTHSA